MRRKLKLLALLFFVVELVLFAVSVPLALVMLGLAVLACGLLFLLLLLNRLYMHTNHWKNRFVYEKNFISNIGYRDNLSRNLDIVNLGSNPAYFGIFYEKVRGQNWSTGSQGLDMDFEILKYFHSYLKKGGVVLIPIMPFTAISQYIKTKPDYWSETYYMKFAKILDPYQTSMLPGGKHLLRLLKYPLLFDPTLLRFLFSDVNADNRLLVTEQTMTALELEQDAEVWIRNWEKEFDARSMDDFLSERYEKYREESVRIVQDMIDFCVVRDLEPVLITIPVSEYLARKFDADFHKRMITDFVEEVSAIHQTRFLDYMYDERFKDSGLYNGSFFLNRKGRQIFSKQLMEDVLGAN